MSLSQFGQSENCRCESVKASYQAHIRIRVRKSLMSMTENKQHNFAFHGGLVRFGVEFLESIETQIYSKYNLSVQEIDAVGASFGLMKQFSLNDVTLSDFLDFGLADYSYLVDYIGEEAVIVLKNQSPRSLGDDTSIQEDCDIDGPDYEDEAFEVEEDLAGSVSLGMYSRSNESINVPKDQFLHRSLTACEVEDEDGAAGFCSRPASEAKGCKETDREVEDELVCGDLIECRFNGNDRYYPGEITRLRTNGTYDILYDDGDTEFSVCRDHIRLRDIRSSKDNYQSDKDKDCDTDTIEEEYVAVEKPRQSSSPQAAAIRREAINHDAYTGTGTNYNNNNNSSNNNSNFKSSPPSNVRVSREVHMEPADAGRVGIAFFQSNNNSNMIKAETGRESVLRKSSPGLPVSKDVGGPIEPRRASTADVCSVVKHHSKQVAWIQQEKWRLGEQIGKGSFGDVFQCMNYKGKLFAVKRMNMVGQRQEVDNLAAEIELMRDLTHPHIVAYVGAFVKEDEGFVYIFQQWVPGGSVAHLLTRFGPFQVEVVRSYTRQILLGLEFLHDKGIIHRDIKGGNVLVDDTGTIKLADFGASTKIAFGKTQETTTIKGTPYFMSPEVLAHCRYGRKGDVWAVGCTMIQMLTGEPPWKDHNLQSLVQLHMLLSSWTRGPPAYDCVVPDDCRECLELCFQKLDTERPTVKELLLCKFLNQDSLDDSCTSVTVESPSGGPGLSDSGIMSGLKQQMVRAVSRGSFALDGPSTGTGTSEDTMAVIDRNIKNKQAQKSNRQGGGGGGDVPPSELPQPPVVQGAARNPFARGAVAVSKEQVSAAARIAENNNSSNNNNSNNNNNNNNNNSSVDVGIPGSQYDRPTVDTGNKHRYGNQPNVSQSKPILSAVKEQSEHSSSNTTNERPRSRPHVVTSNNNNQSSAVDSEAVTPLAQDVDREDNCDEADEPNFRQRTSSASEHDSDGPEQHSRSNRPTPRPQSKSGIASASSAPSSSSSGGPASNSPASNHMHRRATTIETSTSNIATLTPPRRSSSSSVPASSGAAHRSSLPTSSSAAAAGSPSRSHAPVIHKNSSVSGLPINPNSPCPQAYSQSSSSSTSSPSAASQPPNNNNSNPADGHVNNVIAGRLWKCLKCSKKNIAADDACAGCATTRGASGRRGDDVPVMARKS